MINTIIFDFGDVIVNYDQNKIIQNFVDEKDKDELYNACYYDWTALDRGEISYSDYIKNAKKDLREDLHKNADDLFENWYKHLPYTKDIIELIISLKENGYFIYLLSNAPDYLEKNIKHFKILDFFDGIVISGSIKKYKPNDDIYQYITEKYSLTPQNCIFIDDRIQNVEAAERNGFNTVHFNGDVKNLTETLEEKYKVHLY